MVAHAIFEEPADAGGQLWREISSTMRELRQGSGFSLRAVERNTPWGRGSLSQVENGKSRPSRAQVEWYDRHFDADGALVSLFAEARGAHGPGTRGETATGLVDGDRVEAVDPLLAHGALVAPDSTPTVGWTLRNAGSVVWRGRALHRVGPRAAPGMIRSPGEVPVPDCDPGQAVDVRFRIVVPDVGATVVAAWEIVDDRGRPCFGPSSILRTTLVVVPGFEGPAS